MIILQIRTLSLMSHIYGWENALLELGSKKIPLSSPKIVILPFSQGYLVFSNDNNSRSFNLSRISPIWLQETGPRIIKVVDNFIHSGKFPIGEKFRHTIPGPLKMIRHFFQFRDNNISCKTNGLSCGLHRTCLLRQNNMSSYSRKPCK